jgi:cell division protein FtsL
MSALSHLWKEQTEGFSFVQKIIIGTILTFILVTAVFALFLVYLELQK